VAGIIGASPLADPSRWNTSSVLACSSARKVYCLKE
jgi:hypothetical protein